mmetsp:Transcript_64919/g.130529  ORF Transcript_64919/g.130529 Transcript_64919/m.130529 type:complete len:200 (+) Transcript_64919:132-731(+)
MPEAQARGLEGPAVGGHDDAQLRPDLRCRRAGAQERLHLRRPLRAGAAQRGVDGAAELGRRSCLRQAPIPDVAIAEVLHDAPPVLTNGVQKHADQRSEVCLHDAQVFLLQRKEGMGIQCILFSGDLIRCLGARVSAQRLLEAPAFRGRRVTANSKPTIQLSKLWSEDQLERAHQVVDHFWEVVAKDREGNTYPTKEECP